MLHVRSSEALYHITPDFDRFRPNLDDDFRSMPEGEVVSTGYVLHTLHAGLWCLLTTNGYKDCVLQGCKPRWRYRYDWLRCRWISRRCLRGPVRFVGLDCSTRPQGRFGLPLSRVHRVVLPKLQVGIGTQMTTVSSTPHLRQRITGVLLGTAVGDALGCRPSLPSEADPSPMAGTASDAPYSRRGMMSDDTEHTLMVAQALLSHPKDPVTFQRALAWKFRWWFAGLPGGVGLATAKACLRLWIGFPANNCAVVSAGSGPAMRSAIIGAFFASEPEKRREFVMASSRLTHRGWQAEIAALAVAEAAALAVRSEGAPESGRGAFNHARPVAGKGMADADLTNEACLKAERPVSDFVGNLGLKGGVTGYSLHVVPVALYTWLRHPDDFRSALTSAIECGGDTDTVGAILGALCGATTGTKVIPAEWIQGIWEWPRSCRFIERLAERLADQENSSACLGPVRYFWPGLIPRNLLFLAVVLAHGFRRLAPPY